MWKSRTIVVKTFITLVLSMTAIRFSGSGLIAGAKDSNKGRQTVFFTAVDPMNEPQEKVRNWTKWKVYQITVSWINLEKCSRQRISILVNTFQRHHPGQPCVSRLSGKKKVHTKTNEIQHQKIHLSPRLPRKIISRSVWQVQLEGRVQHEGLR